MFPISRDPPEGGTEVDEDEALAELKFPISRDPPEGGTRIDQSMWSISHRNVSNF